MTFIEAAAEVLRKAGKPLHYKEITELAIAGNLLSHVGKTPEVTMSHRLTSAIKKNDKEVPITKIRPGVFALREWEEKKGKKGAVALEASVDEVEGGEDGVEVNALEIEAALRGAKAEKAAAEQDDDDADDDDVAEPETVVSGEDALRGELAASGADLFDDEDDDDQPILGGPQQPGAPAAAQGEGGRRRRRRRRRGRGGSAQGELPGAGFSGPAGAGAHRRTRGRARERGEARASGRGARRSRASTVRTAPQPAIGAPSIATVNATETVIATQARRRVPWCATASRSWPAASPRASTFRWAKATS